jgi:Na+/phosphate symporter
MIMITEKFEKYDNEFLSIIDTLYRRIGELNLLLWSQECEIKMLKKELSEKEKYISELNDIISYRDDEINTINSILETSDNVSRLMALSEEKENIQKLYHKQVENMKVLLDIDFTL